MEKEIEFDFSRPKSKEIKRSLLNFVCKKSKHNKENIRSAKLDNQKSKNNIFKKILNELGKISLLECILVLSIIMLLGLMLGIAIDAGKQKTVITTYQKEVLPLIKKVNTSEVNDINELSNIIYSGSDKVKYVGSLEKSKGYEIIFTANDKRDYIITVNNSRVSECSLEEYKGSTKSDQYNPRRVYSRPLLVDGCVIEKT